VPKPRVYKTQAIVLRQRKLGEADKIVTLYTSHGGRVDAVAKGVRRTKSKLAGNLEPLTLGSYLLAEGRELDIVTQAETVDAFAGLREDLERLSRGLYCAELVDRLTPERSEGYPIFRLLQETLGYISNSPAFELAVRRFELRLMDQLGYRPALSTCAVCDTPLQPQTNYWSVSAGGVICPNCTDDSLRLAPLSLNGLKMLRLIERGSFEDASRIRLSGELALELQTCLGDYVKYVMERDVRTARFVESVRTLPPRIVATDVTAEQIAEEA
jgi:DNA repair protein RecO (recombination protein O)